MPAETLATQIRTATSQETTKLKPTSRCVKSKLGKTVKLGKRGFNVSKIAQYKDRVPFGLKLKSYLNAKRPLLHNIHNFEDLELV